MKVFTFICLLAFQSTVYAVISGPTTASGQFSLSFYGTFIQDASNGQTSFASPTSYTKPAGTYTFNEYEVMFEPDLGINGSVLVDSHTVTVTTSSGGGWIYKLLNF